MAAEIPALKVSRDSAIVRSSGDWLHSLMPDGKRDSLYVLVLQYGILYCTVGLLKQHLIAGCV